MGGAVVGAVGLGWWLVAEAERRRQSRTGRQLPLGELARPVALASPQAPRAIAAPQSAAIDTRLRDRVQELNKAIDEVRRRLEQLEPLP
jgi:uncharacterized protein YceH (UPF0502 family)